jgi:hypothetical protein
MKSVGQLHSADKVIELMHGMSKSPRIQMAKIVDNRTRCNDRDGKEGLRTVCGVSSSTSRLVVNSL